MLCLYWILFFLKKFLNYEKIDVKIQILKRDKLIPSRPNRRSDGFRSKIFFINSPKLKVRLSF